MNTSEIVQLKQQIALEYEAAQRGLCALASGTARHDLITRRMENMGHYCQQLEAIAGTQETKRLLMQLGNSDSSITCF